MEKEEYGFDSDLLGLTTLVEFGNDKIRGTASGFFYNELSTPDPKIRGGQWRKIEGTYLITNRHVALLRVNDVEIIPDYFVFNLRKLVDDKIEWLPITLNTVQLIQRVFLHKDNYVDVVAIKVDDLIIDTIKNSPEGVIYSGCLSNDTLPENSPVNIDVTSDVVVASYPRGFYDQFNKFPIVKSGIISSGWNMPFNGKPYFLIDAQLFPGSSGGLVISKPINIAMIDGNIMKSDVKQFVFLGVYSGEPIQQSAPIKIDDITIIKQSSFGLGNVWYSYLIPEIINEGLCLKDTLVK